MAVVSFSIDLLLVAASWTFSADHVRLAGSVRSMIVAPSARFPALQVAGAVDVVHAPVVFSARTLPIVVAPAVAGFLEDERLAPFRLRDAIPAVAFAFV